MLIYLKRNYKNRIPQWGNISDVERAVAINLEKIYRIDPASIVLAMPMWEGAGDIVHDYSGKGNVGAIDGATWQGGRLGFDGDNDFVEVKDNVDFSSATLSVFLWVNGGIQTNQAVISHYDTGSNQRSWVILTSNLTVTDENLKIVVSDNGTLSAGHLKNYEGSIVAFDNSTHSVGFTFNSGVLQLYTDGVQDPSVNKDKDDAITTLHNSTADLHIGTIFVTEAATDFFNGLIKNVLINNIALTADQAALFNDLPYALYQPVARVSYFFPEEVVEEVVMGAIWHHLNKNIGR